MAPNEAQVTRAGRGRGPSGLALLKRAAPGLAIQDRPSLEALPAHRPSLGGGRACLYLKADGISTAKVPVKYWHRGKLAKPHLSSSRLPVDRDRGPGGSLTLRLRVTVVTTVTVTNPGPLAQLFEPAQVR